MIDSYGRDISYARISITDRCNLRCVYCRPDSSSPFTAEVLSIEEILRICRVFASFGIHTIKITGGEPLVRSDAAELIRRLKGLPGIERVSLTTNGQLLSGMVQTLRDTGLDEITISLNTLKSDTYSRLTGQGELARTLAGIDAVFDAGWTTLKLNCVPLSAESRNDAVQIAALSRDRNIQTRFIEMMPIGAGISFPGISSTTVRNWLEAEYGPYTVHMDKLGHGPARYGRFKDFTGSIGFIAPLSEPFCGCCNRIRLNCNGFIRSCLHQDTGTNLQPALVQADDAELEAAIRSAILNKPQGHRFSHTEPLRQAMFRIGG